MGIPGHLLDALADDGLGTGLEILQGRRRQFEHQRRMSIKLAQVGLQQRREFFQMKSMHRDVTLFMLDYFSVLT